MLQVLQPIFNAVTRDVARRYQSRKPGEGFLDAIGQTIGDSAQSVDESIIDPIGNFLVGEPPSPPTVKLSPAQKRDLLNPYVAQADAAAIARQRAQQNNQALRDSIDNRVNSNQWLTERARKQIAPIYRPQIRATKRLIRSTGRQGRRAASDVQGYYDQAGAKVAGMTQASGRSQQKAMNKLGSGNAESRIAAKAMQGGGQASRSFFKQLQGSLAGEGAVAAADTRRSYNDLANQYRQDLGELRSQRAASLQAAKQELKRRINKAGEKIYEDDYLAGIQAGQTRAQAAKQALAVGGSKSKAIKSQVAKSILNNRGNEQPLIRSMEDESNLDFDQVMALIDSKQKSINNIDAEMLQDPKIAQWYNQKMAEIAQLQQQAAESR